MPTALLVMQGAFGFNERHPFVMTITRGRYALAAFYDRFQPNNLAQMYQLPDGGARRGPAALGTAVATPESTSARRRKRLRLRTRSKLLWPLY